VSRRGVAVLVAVAALAWLPAAPAAAQPADVADVSARVDDIQLPVADIDAPIADVESTTEQGAETVVSLSTDVLFAFGSAVLPASAPARLAGLIGPVPRSGALKVHGHTDSVGTPQANLELSRARADAVATAIRGARPDLALDVQGFGEDRPVAPNERGGEDDPAGRAQNRRVELRFTG